MPPVASVNVPSYRGRIDLCPGELLLKNLCWFWGEDTPVRRTEWGCLNNIVTGSPSNDGSGYVALTDWMQQITGRT